MAKQWTNKELDRCAKAYEEGGINLARTVIDRSDDAIYHQMSENRIYVFEANERKGRTRRWFAEDIADIFELSQNKTRKEIADMYKTTVSNICLLINNAMKNGFNEYPLRANNTD